MISCRRHRRPSSRPARRIDQRRRSASVGFDRIARARSSSNAFRARAWVTVRSEEHTSELQSLMRISYAVFCLKKKNNKKIKKVGHKKLTITLRSSKKK